MAADVVNASNAITPPLRANVAGRNAIGPQEANKICFGFRFPDYSLRVSSDAYAVYMPAVVPSLRKIRTVVIEDETMFRQLVVSTLGQLKDLQIVGEFADGKPALEFCLKEMPDLAVIDLMLPDMNGLEIAARLRREIPGLNVLVITAHPNERLPMELMALGVNGYIDKTEPIDYLLSAVKTILAGGMFFATHVQAKADRGAARYFSRQTPRDVKLTTRQREIARMVASGQMSKEIASRLNLSHRTVEKHRENIMQKVGVHDVASLTRWCLEMGLVDP